jgi:hypothetical protein
MRVSRLSALLAVASLGISGCTAEEESASEEEATDVSVSELASGIVVGCFIDTPAWDDYTPEECWRAGAGSPSTASFGVLNIGNMSQYTITWHQAGCSYPNWCNVPISRGQVKTVAATVRYNPTGETAVLSATATWEWSL